MRYVLLALTLSAAVVRGQDPETILTKIAQRYAALDGYHIEGVYEITQTRLGNTNQNSMKFRLDGAAKAHRKPPEGWESIVARIAKDHAIRLQRLAERLQKGAAK